MFEIARQLRADIERLDQRAVFALVYTAAGLTCISYLKTPKYLAAILTGTPLAGIGEEAVRGSNSNLHALAWWVFVSMVFYLIVPMMIVRFIQRRPLSETGLSLAIERGFTRLLLKCTLIMLPLVYLMSLTADFSSKYPFLKVYGDQPYLGAHLLVWELIYFLQFFGLEFFFRGFLLHSLKPSLGLYAIFVMTVPYTMIHFQKPMPETFAAIVAGIFLGWLSYKNGNIWMGLVLHGFVALSMDILALYNKGLLF